MEDRRAAAFPASLAGLQAGMLGVCWMLLWLGISAEWQLRSFWTAENLMSTVFYGERAIRVGFASRTLSGAAVYVLLYSLLGAGFAAVVRDRLSRVRLNLASVLFALFWYYLSFRLMWKSMIPLVALLHSTQPTALGHVLYGVLLGRYPRYLAHAPEAEHAAAATEEVPAAIAEPGPEAGVQEEPSAERQRQEAQGQ
jgi:hypothetical protein